MKNRKKLVSIIGIITITLAFIASMIPIHVAATDPSEWYMTVNGVLDTDYYALYPFEKDDHLRVGFSKYGELIDPNTGTGLNYSGRDPFANEGVNMKYWLNGWVLDARYVHRSYGARHLWAFAMFADMVSYGGEWINNATDPYGAPHGGRKTNGAAETENITVLYDGPRRFVARLVTHLNDTEADASWPVLDVIFTIIFNKVKKQIIVLKDIKLTIDSKILEGPVDVQFGDRGEWDLGPSPEWKSYAHFYHQRLLTCYDANWHLSKNITREFYYHNASFSGNTLPLPDGGSEPYGFPVVDRSEYVFVNDVWQKRGEDYTINYNTGVITFAQTLANVDVKVYYKLYKIDLETRKPIALPHQYDLAQIISSDMEVVGYAAFWPILSDYTVYGWDYSLEPLYNISQADVPTGEPEIPFVIGEWDFMLDYGVDTPYWDKQFRGVTVYGLVDYHDADDANIAVGHLNKIDAEVAYLLAEVFLPWDLYDVVHKDTRRWVQFYNVTSTDEANADLGIPLNITLTHSPVRKVAVWESYCTFSERVLWNGELKYPLRSVYTNYDYELYVNGTTGVGHIWIPASKVPPAGTLIKILYSTDTTYSKLENITYTIEESVARTLIDDVGEYQKSGEFADFTDLLGVNHRFYINSAWFQVTNSTALSDGDSCSLTGTLYWYAYDIKVFKETPTYIMVYWLDSWEDSNTANSITVTFDRFLFSWTITPPTHDDVHITRADIDIWYNITAVYWAAQDKFNITIVLKLGDHGEENTNYIYAEYIAGRYEWTIVGRDSRAVDSAGAAMVTAAFKNKQIEIGLSGLDMQDTLYGPYIPWIVRNLTGTTDSRASYNDAIGREALRDDWCHTWPVSSSNVIAIGGPAANLVTEYFNEFTEAFMINPGLSDYFTAYGILPLTCWNYLNNFTEGNSVSDPYGYAVIATYKDINGTVGFLIWGWTGQDTYYACKFFHEEIIYQLQEFPYCATSIMLKIDYSVDPEHPDFSIVEVLGTISETTAHLVKGGIHPDP